MEHRVTKTDENKDEDVTKKMEGQTKNEQKLAYFSTEQLLLHCKKKKKKSTAL